jgi:hypothetical protein
MAKELLAHPAAECFRLMNEEELSALAADVTANGLTDPIIVGQIIGSSVEFIVDGRNRIKACKMAGIEPKFELRQFESDDAVRAFVKSRGERRDLTKGERAMSIALLFPTETETGGRGKKGSSSKRAAETAGVSHRRIQEARQVLKHSPDLARAVRDGTVRLDDALTRIHDEKKALENTEASMARLRAEAPDLAELVAEERLKLTEAILTLDSRINEIRRQQDTATRALQSVFEKVFPQGATPEEWAERLVADVSNDFWDSAEELSSENLSACAEVMRAISKKWKDRSPMSSG